MEDPLAWLPTHIALTHYLIGFLSVNGRLYTFLHSSESLNVLSLRGEKK